MVHIVLHDHLPLNNCSGDFDEPPPVPSVFPAVSAIMEDYLAMCEMQAVQEEYIPQSHYLCMIDITARQC